MQWTRRFARWAGGKTLKREFAVFGFVVWFAITIKLFFFTADREWLNAQGPNYGTLTSTIWLYIAAAVGLQMVENRMDNPPTPYPPPQTNVTPQQAPPPGQQFGDD